MFLTCFYNTLGQWGNILSCYIHFFLEFSTNFHVFLPPLWISWPPLWIFRKKFFKIWNYIIPAFKRARTDFPETPQWLYLAYSISIVFFPKFPIFPKFTSTVWKDRPKKTSRLRGKMDFFCIEFFFSEFPMKFAIRNMYGTWYYNNSEKGPKSLYMATKRNQDLEM